MSIIKRPRRQRTKIGQHDHVKACQTDQECTGDRQHIARHHGSPTLLVGATGFLQNSPQFLNLRRTGLQ